MAGDGAAQAGEAAAPGGAAAAAAAAAGGTPRPPGRRLAKLATCCAGLCEPGEEPPHARLSREARERREGLQREEERRREERQREREESERKAQEWQRELEEMQRRRDGMCDEELKQDCLRFFESFEILNSSRPSEPEGSRDPAEPAPQGESSPAMSGPQGESSPAGSGSAMAEAASAEPARETAEAPPEGHVELWLARLFGRDCAEPESPGACTLPANGWSFGELDSSACAAVAQSLRDALAAGAEEAEEAAESESKNLQPQAQDGVNDLSERLDQLVAKYAPADGTAGGNTGAPARAEDAGGSAVVLATAAGAVLRARAAQHRAVRDRVQSLLPCLEGDEATARLVAALATLDVGAPEPGSHPARAAGGPPAGFRAPLLALSTADACWALCSESQSLVFKQMLPPTSARESWLWPDIRRTAVGWWLCGSDCSELLDKLITNILTTKVQQLRRHKDNDKEWDMDMARTSQRVSKGYVDEVVFWHALKGTRISTLGALVRTGLFSSEPGMAAILQHQSAGDAEFLRKNAFRLIGLHRYHLAAALFVMSDSMDQAVRVVAQHMRDMQLVLLLTRHCREKAGTLLRDTLRESSLAQRDPWLRLLLGWHFGDVEAAARCAREAEAPPADAGDVQGALPELFDEVLRCSRGSPGMREVASGLRGRLAAPGRRTSYSNSPAH